MRQTKDARLFFALWPDDATRDWIRRSAAALPLDSGARRVPSRNLHLTLHFIGNVYRDEMDCLRRRARRVRAQSFSLTLDRFGHFRRARVAWLGCREIPPALSHLHESLGEELSQCEFEPEARPYNPHITLLRKSLREPDAFGGSPWQWRVENFVLVESRNHDDGVKYEVLETYPLQ